MWWTGAGWGPMYGWWLMPLFGIICMVVFLYAVSIIFGRGFCGRQSSTEQQRNIEELTREVRELRSKIKALEENKKAPGEDSS